MHVSVMLGNVNLLYLGLRVWPARHIVLGKLVACGGSILSVHKECALHVQH